MKRKDIKVTQKKGKIIKRVVAYTLAITCVVNIGTQINVNASSKENKNVVRDVQSENEVIEFEYSSSALDDSSVHLRNEAIFKTEYFTKDSREYNHELAKLSLDMAFASSTTAESKVNWGTNFNNVIDTSYDLENIDLSTARNAYIVEVYKKLGFYNDVYGKYETSLNDASDTVAYSIAMKDIKINGKNYVLLLCNARSVSYGAEWGSNFNAYNEDGITGFEASGIDFYNAITKYIKEHKLGKNTKVWIPGYSRGGAAANVAAGMLNKDIKAGKYKFSHKDVYAYMYATPLSVKDDEAHSSIHYNIFNILNEADIVTRLQVEAWGFKRYGRNYYLPQIYVTDKELDKIAKGKKTKLDKESVELIKSVSYSYNVRRYQNMLNNNEDVDLNKLYIGFTVSKNLTEIVDNFVPAMVSSPKEYSEKYQGVAMDIIPFCISHSKTYDEAQGQWVPFDNLADYMYARYGKNVFDEAEKAGVYSEVEHKYKIQNIQDSKFMNASTKKALQFIVETYYGVRIIAFKYGIDVEEIKKMSNNVLGFAKDYISKFNITDPFRCKHVHYAEFYRSWMDNYNPYTKTVIK